MQVLEYCDGKHVGTYDDMSEACKGTEYSLNGMAEKVSRPIVGIAYEYVLCDMSLNMMYRMQRLLQFRVGVLPVYDEKKRSNLLMNHSQYLDQELHEMLREVPFFKSWKKYDWTIVEEVQHKELAKEEAIDAFHFMLNILLLLDITPDELAKRYVEKNTINHVRQDNNY